MRGVKTDAGARVITAGHAFVQNVRRGHYELVVDEPLQLRVAVAFDELATAPDGRPGAAGRIDVPQLSTNATRPSGMGWPLGGGDVAGQEPCGEQGEGGQQHLAGEGEAGGQRAEQRQDGGGQVAAPGPEGVQG